MIVLNMCQRDKAIQIGASLVTGCQNDGMVRRHLLNIFHRGGCHLIDLIKRCHTTFLKHRNKFHKNLCSTCRIIDRTMVVIE